MYTYEVIDTQTKNIIGTFATSKQAHRKADKLDSAYGAVRYSVRCTKVA